MDSLEKQLLEMGYIKSDRCIPKPVIFGRSGSTNQWYGFAHCPICNANIERRLAYPTTALANKTYKEFCSQCGQLLEIPYK